jgi:DEK C terminal domain
MPTELEIWTHVHCIVHISDLTTLTTKQVRQKVEEELNLEEDELTSPQWKSLVKTAIADAMEEVQQKQKDGKVKEREVEVVSMYLV